MLCSGVSRDVKVRSTTFLFTLPSTGGSFLGGGGSGIACPGFSVLRFRREFLSRMWTTKGNRAWMHDLARFGMDADRGRPQPMITYAILLRNSQPGKVHGKPGQAIPLPPPPKKLPPVRPPINITFQAELLLRKPIFAFPIFFYFPPYLSPAPCRYILQRWGYFPQMQPKQTVYIFYSKEG